jgi:hypothetical protein
LRLTHPPSSVEFKTRCLLFVLCTLLLGCSGSGRNGTESSTSLATLAASTANPIVWSGTMRYDDGAPVAGATVEAIWTNGPFDGVWCRQGIVLCSGPISPGGRFCLEIPPLFTLIDEVISLRVVRDGTTLFLSKPVSTYFFMKLREQDITVACPGSIKGQVTDSVGRPLSGAVVRMYPSRIGVLDTLETTATSLSDGSFSIPVVTPGSKILVTIAPGKARNVLTYDVISRGTADIHITLSDGAEIGGRMISGIAHGKIGSVPIWALKRDGEFGSCTVSQENGEFCFSDLEAGDYNLGASHSLEESDRRFWRTGTRDAVVRVGSLVTIHGSVIGESGEPIDDFVIQLSRADRPGIDLRLGFFNARGRFAIDLDISELPIDIMALAPGYAPTRLTFSQMPIDLAGPVITIALARGAAVSGVVMDADGHPIEGVWLSAIPGGISVPGHASIGFAPRFDGNAACLSNDSGQFSIPDLCFGEYTILAQKAGYLPGIVERVVVSPGDAVVMADVVLTPGCRLMIRFSDSPEAGTYVRVSEVGGRGCGTMPIPDGVDSLACQGLSAGSYRVELCTGTGCCSRTIKMAEVRVEPGAPCWVDL